MHLAEGKGNLIGVLRDPAIHLSHTKKLAATAGPGESSYTRYDRDIAVRAQAWLREQAPKYQDKPWVLFVSFISPHFPLICPPEFFNLYDPAEFALPKLHRHALGDAHAYVKDHASSHNYAVHFKDDDHVRQALAAYYGLCSFIDAQIGLGA